MWSMTSQGNGQRQVLTPDEVEKRVIEIQKAMELGSGLVLKADAVDRARRILTGLLTEEQAVAEIFEKYARYSNVSVADPKV